MDATQKETAQDVQNNPEAQIEQSNQPTQFDNMSQDELKDFTLKLSSQLHKVNEESKGRKIKLRELEADKQERETALLEEQGKYKELYESTLKEVDELRPLKDFKDQHDKLQADKLVELEKQLTNAEREELSIFDDLTNDKKTRWIELKLKNRSSVNLDTSSSAKSGGSLKQRPKNRQELNALTTEDMKAFRTNYPQEYMVAMNTK